MSEFKARVIDPIGFHARPASKIVVAATPLTSTITLFANGREVNIKSIIGIMSLGVKTGQEIIVKAIGKSDKADLAKIKAIMHTEKLI